MSEAPESTFKKKSKKKKYSYKKYVRIFWILFLVFTLGLSGFILGIYHGYIGEEMLTIEELENPETNLATEIYSADGVLLGKYYRENRTYAMPNEISKNLYDALIATEDKRFYKHSGIDWYSVASVPWYILKGDKKGASTISQQLAKNMFKKKDRNNLPKFQLVIAKLQEWIMAVRLERYYTKDEIVAMYFNTVEFGLNTYGIKSASNTFFNKNPIDLNKQEAAVLVGVLKAITKYSPKLNPESSLNRRNVVLTQMNKNGYLTNTEFDSIRALPIKLDLRIESHTQGIAQYFREELRKYMHQWCRENGYDLYSSGLKVYTTIDTRMQKYAEDASFEHLSELQKTFYKHWDGVKKAPYDYRLSEDDIENLLIMSMKRTDRYRALKRDKKSDEEIMADFKKPREMELFSYGGSIDTTLSPYDSIKYYKWFLNPGFLAMETHSGKIRAWVGGIDYKYFQYDHVNINAKRQVGSTFKPFVYTVGVMEAYSPCTKAPNQRVVFPDFDNWSPENSDGKYGGYLSLEEGLAQSNNCITAWVMYRVRPEPVIDLVSEMGLDTSNIDPYPSICLGTPDVSVYEMVGAFNTFGNKGIFIKPTFIERIVDKDGVVYEEYPTKREVLDEEYNYVMLSMLMNTSRIKNGTALRLRGSKYKFRNEIAAKTGTTQNNSDGWFIGIVPQMTAGAWVGAEDRSVHFRYTSLGQGANMALPIWALYMKKVYADSTLGIEPLPFEKPKGDLPFIIDCSEYDNEDEEGDFTKSEYIF